MSKVKAKVVTILQSLRSPHSWANARLWFYLGGLAVFHSKANFDEGIQDWWKQYYIFAFAEDFLATVLCIVVLWKTRTLLLPAFLYSFYRVWIEFETLFLDENAPNLYPFVQRLFMLAMIGIVTGLIAEAYDRYLCRQKY